jgi:hypothetical protein
MPLIYNIQQSEIDANNPVFLPGMNCANFIGTQHIFSSVDVSRLTDLSLFFADSPNMVYTPTINVQGKTGLDTMLKGCTSLLILKADPVVNQDITFYTEPNGDILPASTFAMLLCNGYILDMTAPYVNKTVTLANSMYNQVVDLILYQSLTGSWLAYPTTESVAKPFVEIMNDAGWNVEPITNPI